MARMRNSTAGTLANRRATTDVQSSYWRMHRASAHVARTNVCVLAARTDAGYLLSLFLLSGVSDTRSSRDNGWCEFIVQ